jgi:hypothetical protein
LTGWDVPGHNCIAQLSVVTRWYQDDQRDPGRLHAVAWGQRPGTALEAAVGAKAGDPDWAERLGRQLEVFIEPCRWPLDYLASPRPEGRA